MKIKYSVFQRSVTEFIEKKKKKRRKNYGEFAS